MYVPGAFVESDMDRLHEFIEQNSFGLLVTQFDGLPFATHLPILLKRTCGPQGTLIGHLARANPQWQQASGQTVLTVFSGPHTYISPTWYEAENVVPTWNYVAIHAYGKLQILDQRKDLLEIVQAMVDFYEQSRPQPWKIGEVDTFVDRMLSQIVGFQIVIERIEGKWKLNQNHPVERRKKVIRALRQQVSPDANAIAELMEQSFGFDQKEVPVP